MKRFLLAALLAIAAPAFAAPALTTTAIQTITGAKTFSGSCKLLLAGSTSGTTCLQAPAIAGSTTAIVFPATAGTLATLADIASASIAASQLTGTIAAARMPALTGDITSSVGAVATTLATVNSTVGTFGSTTKAGIFTTNGKGLITAASESTVTPALGSITGFGTGVATWLATPTGANLVSALSSGGGTSSFLRADGAFATPSGAGDVAGPASAVNNRVVFFDGTTGKLIKDSGLTLSGSNTGDQTSVSGNAGTATALAAARTIAITGDLVYTSPSFDGSGNVTAAGTLANIPTAVPVAGYMLHSNIAAPSTPAAGKTSVWTDSTSKTLKAINDAGTSSTTIIADTGASNNFLTAISASGVVSKAQPAFSNLSGSVAAGQMPALTGDVTTSAGAVATALATVNSNVGTFGSATKASVVTVNGKGLATAASETTVTPAVGSITGLGTGIATALAVNVGSAGAPVVLGGALGTPSSGTATNLSGTAASLTAGNVTTNANLTGDVTSSGNATTLATVNSNVGSFTSANITVNGKGLVTAAANGTGGSGGGGGHVINARLTLTSATPITTADVTGATSIYWTPTNGNTVTLWDGSAWTQYTLTEVTIALGTLTSGKPYDVFGYQNSGTPAAEVLVWTNDTTRATAVTLQDGRYAKSGDKTRLYLGTFYTTSTTTTEDSAAKRYLWNQYNQARRFMNNALETTDTWNYSTATWRQANANTANQLDCVIGTPGVLVEAIVKSLVLNSTANGKYVAVGIGVDSTSVNSAQLIGQQIVQTSNLDVRADYKGYPGVGRHYFPWLEIGAGGDTQTWNGDAGTPTKTQAGILGSILGAANDDQYEFLKAA